MLPKELKEWCMFYTVLGLLIIGAISLLAGLIGKIISFFF